LSAECLKDITGLTNMRYQDMDAWSQAMIDGIANYSGNKEVEARCHAATAGIDAAIDDMVPVLIRHPNQSILSVLLAASQPMESVRANVKLAISGGQNEPRDAISGTIWALLTHPDQLALVRQQKAKWIDVFEEYARWIAPIGMSPRRVAKRWSYGGVDFEPEDRVFFMFGSANRDENCFENPELFDITRDTQKSIAFGAGPHYCAGAFASRAMVADVALPSIFARLNGLRLDDSQPVRIGGWAFRGLLNLPVAWDVSQNVVASLFETRGIAAPHHQEGRHAALTRTSASIAPSPFRLRSRGRAPAHACAARPAAAGLKPSLPPPPDRTPRNSIAKAC
jgi:cytochrome P450